MHNILCIQPSSSFLLKKWDRDVNIWENGEIVYAKHNRNLYGTMFC